VAGTQLQTTPAFAVSLATVAATGAVLPTTRDDGGGVYKESEMGVEATWLVETLLQAERVERTRRRVEKLRIVRFIGHQA
jgi:hypothetical protein